MVAIPLVLDTDIGTNVDDALALGLAVRHPGIDLQAVTTVSGDTSARTSVAARLLAVAGRRDVEVAAATRDAATVLLEASQVNEAPVVAALGPHSNLATALARDPTYPSRVPLLAVMGGVFGTLRDLDGTVHTAARDHNLAVDPDAAVHTLGAGFDVLYVPCDVTFGVALREHHLHRLRRGDPLCNALAELVDAWALAMLGRRSRGEPSDVVAMLHDPLTVACVVEPSLVAVETLPVSVVVQDGVPCTLVDPIGGVPSRVVRSVDADAFAEWWLEVVLGA